MDRRSLRQHVLTGETVRGSMMFELYGRKRKKGLGFMAASADWARQYRKLGFNILAAGPHQALPEAVVRGILASVAEAR